VSEKLEAAYDEWLASAESGTYSWDAFKAGWEAALKAQADRLGLLMQQIAKGDYANGVYNLSVSAGDHFGGFNAVATMRASGEHLEFHGDTPEGP
jgi:hypothetical protein